MKRFVGVITAFMYFLLCMPAGAAALLQSNEFGTEIPVPPVQHPRLFIQKDGIEALRQKMQNSYFEPELAQMREYASAEIDGSFPAFDGSGYNNIRELTLNQMEAKAFFYLITGDKQYAKDAGSCIVNALNSYQYNPASDPTFLGRSAGNLLDVASVIYDWCYDVLSADQKKIIISKCDAMMRSSFEFSYPIEDKNLLTLIGHINEEQLTSQFLMFSAAVYDEDPSYWENNMPYVLNYMIPAYNYAYTGLSHWQGISYGNTRFKAEVICDMLLSSMGFDFFSDDIAKIPYKFIYGTRPDGAFLREGDMFDPQYYAPNQRVGYKNSYFYLANKYQDPYLKGEFNRLTEGGLRFVDPLLSVFFIYEDPDLTGKSLQELPKTAFYPSPFGAMIARTGFGEGVTSDDVVALMNIGDYHFTNHMHDDAGSFQLYYKGYLALDSGLYGGVNGDYASDHDKYYYKRTVAHNAMLFTNNEDPLGNQYTYPYGPKSVEVFTDSGNYNRATTLAHSFGDDDIEPDYSYIKGDLTKAYPGKTNGYERSFVFLNFKDEEVPATLIVYDNFSMVQSTNSQAKWLLHSQEEPRLTGNTITFDKTDNGASGRLINNVVLPDKNNIKMEVIGGEGREFEVNGVNYPQTPRDGNALDNFEGGKYRVEVSAKNYGETTRYLNVMQVQDADDSIKKNPIYYFDNMDMLGITISDRAVFFAKERDIVSNTSVSIKGKQDQLYKYLLCDMQPGYYTVTKEGEEPDKVFTVEEGGNTLYFQDIPGTFQISYFAEKPDLPDALKVPSENKEQKISVKINDEFIGTKVAPQLVENRVLVPVREIFEKTGAVVSYEEATEKVTVAKDNLSVELRIDSREAVVNGEANQLDVPAMVLDGRTLVPIRFIAETLGAEVNWDEVKRQVSIQYKTGNEREYETYTPVPEISFEILKDSQLQELTVKEATANTAFDSAGLVIDGEITPRAYWGGDGDGAYVQLDLGEVKTLNRVDVAYHKGNTRQNKVNIAVSEDGIHYTMVYGGTTDGSTLDFYHYPVPETQARYVRIIGYGSPDTGSVWTSITEIKLFGRK